MVQKTFIGPQLRQLRRERNETQSEMAKNLGVSAAYVNLLENNQRSLSVKMLMAVSDAYQLDWQELVKDRSSTLLSDLRNVMQDPIFADAQPDLQELRAALDHSPRMAESVVKLHAAYRMALDQIMRQGAASGTQAHMAASPEASVYSFFRDHQNYFPTLEEAADKLRASEGFEADDVYHALKTRIAAQHHVRVEIKSVDEMQTALRVYDEAAETLYMSEALDYQNRVFQMAHIICLFEFRDLLDALTGSSALQSETAVARCNVELANYFAAAVLMPYDPFLAEARRTQYDIDRIAASFGVSFEQVCHRLTTLQRKGALGVPFFFLRVDKAGNVSKRFNATSFNLAEYGGSCPVWNIHTAFRTPGMILPQFVELPDGERFFTLSRTTDRPSFNFRTQDHRLAVAIGCEIQYADQIKYAGRFNQHEPDLFSKIGINCHLCPRTACSQRAHQPLMIELPIDPNRRGNTRYES